jgi:hypothetical protein
MYLSPPTLGPFLSYQPSDIRRIEENRHPSPSLR